MLRDMPSKTQPTSNATSLSKNFSKCRANERSLVTGTIPKTNAEDQKALNDARAIHRYGGETIAAVMADSAGGGRVTYKDKSIDQTRIQGVSGEYVWETDAEWRYTYLSERVETVLGYTRAELLGRAMGDFMPLGEPDTVLATILFTDIVGSTAKAAELGDRAWADLVQRHHAVVRAQLDRFRGRELDTAGDGFFASFDGPIRAIRW